MECSAVNSGTTLPTFGTKPLFPDAGYKTVAAYFHQTAWHQILEDGLIYRQYYRTVLVKHIVMWWSSNIIQRQLLTAYSIRYLLRIIYYIFFFIFRWPSISVQFVLINNLTHFSMCLFHFSTCLEQPSAHHQENQLYQYICTSSGIYHSV